MSPRPKLLLVWHEAGNRAYWDRFRALSAFFDVTVLGLRKFQGIQFTDADPGELFVLHLFDAYFSNHWLSFISLRMLAALWRDKADLVYLHEEPHALTSFAAALLKRRRLIFLDSAVINRKANFLGLNVFERLVYRAADGVFGRNQEVVQTLRMRGCPEAKILGTLGNGVSDATFFSDEKDMARRRLMEMFPQVAPIVNAGMPIVGFAGRIWRPKGIALFRELVKAYPCKVMVCGPLVDEDLAAELRESGVAVLPKLSPDILRSFYSALDVFVLPSIPTPFWREQFGRVLTESIFCGTPALGSNIGAIPAILGNDATFTPQDVDSLVACLERHGGVAQRKALLDRQTANVNENFTWSAIVKKMDTAYRRFCPNPERQEVVIFQNYFTPYRADLFEILGRTWGLALLYIHRPEDEGRKWLPREPAGFRALYARYFYIGKMVFFRFFRGAILNRDIACVILLDDNPSNLLMIFYALFLRLRSKARILLWVEHIPDPYKPLLKYAYQKLCSRILVALSDGVLAFSAMTEQYLSDIGAARPIFRVNQAVSREGIARGRARTSIRKFGYLGSAHPRKNVTVLLEAFRQMNIEGLELHVAGFNPSHPRSSQANLFWHGYVDGADKEKFFEQIDALILPSLAEPWGLVINEALARNCICLVSDRCGSREIVMKADPRLVFAPTIAGISEAVRFCCSRTDQQVVELSAAFQEFYRPYSLDHAAAQISCAIRNDSGKD